MVIRLCLIGTASLACQLTSAQSVQHSVARLKAAHTEGEFRIAFDSMIYFLHAGKLDFQKEDVHAIIDIARQKTFGDRMLPKVYGWATSMVGSGRLDEALTFYLETAEYYKSKRKAFGEALSHFEIALIYHKAAHYAEARQHYELTLDIGRDSLDHRTLINCYNGLALILRDEEEYSRAKSSFRQAYEVARDHADTAWIAILAGNIGSCHLAQESYDSSAYCYHLNLSLIRQTNEFENEIETYVNLGKVYLKKGLLVHAQLYVDSALRIIDERKIVFNDFFNPMDQIYRTYGDICSSKGDYKQAYFYEAKFHQAAQQKQGDLNGRNLKQLEALHNFQRSQREVGLLKDINEANLLAINQQKYIALSLTIIVSLLLAVLIIIVRNAHMRKRMNGKLQESNIELERLNSVKNVLLSVISHDLRNPIANLRGTLNLVRDGLLSKEELTAVVEAIDHRLKLSTEALENVLRWGKAQLTRRVIASRRVVIVSLVGQVLDQLRMDISRKNIEVMNCLSDSLACWADKDQLEVILRNIVGNALKFTPNGGSIQICGKLESNLVTVSVTDSGVGMSAHQISRLFKPGPANSTPGTNKEPGSGIGLILAKEMVVANKGNISVESELNRGTTFFITLPAGGDARPLD